MTITHNDAMNGDLYVALRVSIMVPRIQPGMCVPNVNLSRINPDGAIENFSTRVELSEEKWAVFCVVKAFTPVCSQQHFPGMVKAAEAFQRCGVRVACLSVNTRDEMNAWGAQHDPTGKVKMIPDYNGDFVWLLGLGMDKCKERHLGFVSRRAAILFEDGVCKAVKIEADARQCEVSSADHFLSLLPNKV
jgi:glutaredoxin/glutathione-dependent peroxiredoxin